jgi:hypothetical protein
MIVTLWKQRRNDGKRGVCSMSSIAKITLKSGRVVSKETVLLIIENLIRQKFVYDEDSGMNVIDELTDEAFTINDELTFNKDDAEELVMVVEDYAEVIAVSLEESLAAKLKELEEN